MTVPTVAAVATGQKITSALGNAPAAILQWVDVDRPITWLVQTSTQSIPNTTNTPITFQSEPVDRAAMHPTNGSKINVGLSLGLYLVFGTVAWGSNTTGTRRAIVQLNGGNVPGIYGVASSRDGLATASCWGVVDATLSTDYIQLCGYQDSGGALSTLVSGAYQCSFGAVRIGS